jgi:muconolactone delta-isomerase
MRFLVEGTFAQMPTPEVLALIPAEVEHGLALDAAGIREQLYVAADQSKAWQLYRGETLDEVRAIVAGFPLYPYLNIMITPLAS